jgi:type IV pilus assembly protein PilF
MMLFLKFAIEKLLMGKRISMVALLLMSTMLSSCVTTTTGGFLVDASEEQAVADYVQLALAYFEADDMAGARRHVSNAMDIDTRSSDAYMVSGMIFQREGDLDLADADFRKSISLDRNNSRARNNYAAMLYSQEQYRDASEQLQEVANDTEYEGRALAFEGLGRSLLKIGRTEEAQAAFLRALQLNGNLYIAALELALIYFEQQEYESARQTYQSYLTTAEFYNIPHTPRALLAGIQIEGHFQNDRLVKDFSLVLSTLYPSSLEYETYQRLTNAN